MLCSFYARDCALILASMISFPCYRICIAIRAIFFIWTKYDSSYSKRKKSIASVLFFSPAWQILSIVASVCNTFVTWKFAVDVVWTGFMLLWVLVPHSSFLQSAFSPDILWLRSENSLLVKHCYRDDLLLLAKSRRQKPTHLAGFFLYRFLGAFVSAAGKNDSPTSIMWFPDS